MLSQKVLDSFIIRLVEEKGQRSFDVHHLKTGEKLRFESWVAAWCHLESLFDKLSTPIDKLSTPKKESP